MLHSRTDRQQTASPEAARRLPRGKVLHAGDAFIDLRQQVKLTPRVQSPSWVEPGHCASSVWLRSLVILPSRKTVERLEFFQLREGQRIHRGVIACLDGLLESLTVCRFRAVHGRLCVSVNRLVIVRSWRCVRCAREWLAVNDPGDMLCQDGRKLGVELRSWKLLNQSGEEGRSFSGEAGFESGVGKLPKQARNEQREDRGDLPLEFLITECRTVLRLFLQFSAPRAGSGLLCLELSNALSQLGNPRPGPFLRERLSSLAWLVWGLNGSLARLAALLRRTAAPAFSVSTNSATSGAIARMSPLRFGLLLLTEETVLVRGHCAQPPPRWIHRQAYHDKRNVRSVSPVSLATQ